MDFDSFLSEDLAFASFLCRDMDMVLSLLFSLDFASFLRGDLDFCSFLLGHLGFAFCFFADPASLSSFLEALDSASFLHLEDVDFPSFRFADLLGDLALSFFLSGVGGLDLLSSEEIVCGSTLPKELDSSSSLPSAC